MKLVGTPLEKQRDCLIQALHMLFFVQYYLSWLPTPFPTATPTHTFDQLHLLTGNI